MKITFKIVLLSFLFFSCKETPEKRNQKTTKKAEIQQKQDLADNNPESQDSDRDFRIKFPDLTLFLKDIDMSCREEYNEIAKSYEATQDTIFFDLFAGDWMNDKSFKIEQPQVGEIEFYGKYEMRIGINTEREIEVPFCVLEDWKKYTSEWVKIDVDQDDLRFPITDILENHSKMPKNPIPYTLDELKAAVNKHCGADWYDEIKNVQTIDKVPVDFFEYRYIYKIKTKNIKTNKVIEKYLVFYTPTSC
ncbi:hypothetical protein ACFFLS_09895 [Flavobacterium procerum]|uniref:Lipoprotein n=1 Tax=Flavobacterium procerum TaxID=1455569 RepID=A0ABV6BRT5_9FLAO